MRASRNAHPPEGQPLRTAGRALLDSWTPFEGRAKSALRRSSVLRAGVVSLRHRGLEAGDCFIASFPRSGNTWLRFLLATLATGREVDYEQIDSLIPGVGAHRGAPRLASGSRLIKTHEPYRPEYKRAVYMVRDVRDVVLSWYRTTRPDRDNFADFDAFLERFVAGEAAPYGKWTDHVLSWLRRSLGDAEILLMPYEKFQADTLACLRRVAEFARVQHDEDQLHEALDRCSIGNMQRLQRVNADYLRRAYDYRIPDSSGTAGGWRHKLTDRHLQLLAPALELQRDLVYGRMNISV